MAGQRGATQPQSGPAAAAEIGFMDSESIDRGIVEPRERDAGGYVRRGDPADGIAGRRHLMSLYLADTRQYPSGGLLRMKQAARVGEAVESSRRGGYHGWIGSTPARGRRRCIRPNTPST